MTRLCFVLMAVLAMGLFADFDAQEYYPGGYKHPTAPKCNLTKTEKAYHCSNCGWLEKEDMISAKEAEELKKQHCGP